MSTTVDPRDRPSEAVWTVRPPPVPLADPVGQRHYELMALLGAVLKELHSIKVLLETQPHS